MEWLYYTYYNRCVFLPVSRVSFTVLKAIQYGTVNILKQLLQLGDKLPPKSIDKAAEYGQLAIIQWIHNHPSNQWRDNFSFTTVDATKQAIYHAAFHGRLDIVKWLYENRKEGCNEEAISAAASNGHLDIVKYLYQHNQPYNLDSILFLAARHGHFPIIQWACEMFSANFSMQSAFDGAISSGFINIAKFVLPHTIRCTSEHFEQVASNGHLETLEWLYVTFPTISAGNALIYAAKNGHLKTVIWISTLHPEAYCSKDAMNYAARYGHFDIVQWLYENRKEGCSEKAWEWSIENGHVDIVNWLESKQLLPKQLNCCQNNL